MGMFSYLCKECRHPLLSKGATNPGINDWMCRAVILTNRGETFIGEYDGYGRAGGEDDLEYHACLHEACWEKAGKPNFADYGSPSDHAPDQGWFFDDGDHDLIDPRITEGRDELLKAGIEARVRARFDEKARLLRELITPSKYNPETPAKKRFSLMGRYEDGELVEGGWTIGDRLDLLSEDEHYDDGEEAEVWARLEARFQADLESPEGKALLARGIEIRDEGRRAYLENVRSTGRYVVGYCPSRHPDLQRGHVTKFYVRDEMMFKDVAVFDYTGEADDHKDRMNKAVAEAARLNAAWVAEGYPWTWEEE